MFDILILAAEKDFNKLKFVYESINKNIINYNKIHCITNKKIEDKEKISGIEYYTDDDVVNFDFSKFKGNVKIRKGWYAQQYIKLFQNVTLSNYLIVDSDIYFNKKIEIDINNPTFFLGRNQHHRPYFEFMKRFLNLDRVHNYSFINEIMLFKKENIQKMLDVLKMTPNDFFESSVEILNDINQISGISEYELYGNFVTKYFPNTYNYKHIKTHLGGKHSVWDDQEVLNYIKMYENTDYDIISMHSWT